MSSYDTSYYYEDEPPRNPEYEKIGGWLLFHGVGFVLGIGMGLVGIMNFLAVKEEFVNAGFGGIYTLEFLAHLFFMGLLLITATQFFGKKKTAPALMIAIFLLVPVVSFVLYTVETNAGADMIAELNLFGFIRGIIVGMIWIPYYCISERVKGTFVN